MTLDCTSKELRPYCWEMRRAFLFSLLVVLLCSCAKKQVKFGSGLGHVKSGPGIATVEKEMRVLLNRDRAQRGVPPLKWDSRLAEIGRFHSSDMKKSDFFGHVSPNTGSLDDRLVRAGYLAAVARENVAIAPDIKTGQKNLMNSRGHRENILSEDITRVGIGIVRGSSKDPGSLTITQVFSQPVSTGAPGQTKERILKSIRQIRRQNGLRPIQTDGTLMSLAKKHIKKISGDSSGRGLRKVGADVKKDFERKRRGDGGALVTVAQQIFQAQDYQPSSAITSPRAVKLGLAVVRSRDEQGRPKLTLLVIVLMR